jgi:hypothetical protein
MMGAVVGDKAEELPSPEQDRLREDYRCCGKYLRYSLLFLVAWISIALSLMWLQTSSRSHVPDSAVPWDVVKVVYAAFFMFLSTAGLLFNIAAIRAGIKAVRQGYVKGVYVVALGESPVQAFLFVCSFWMFLRGGPWL